MNESDARGEDDLDRREECFIRKGPRHLKRIPELRSRILRKHDLEIEEIFCANDRFYQR